MLLKLYTTGYLRMNDWLIKLLTSTVSRRMIKIGSRHSMLRQKMEMSTTYTVRYKHLPMFERSQVMSRTSDQFLALVLYLNAP
jgi:hypothetical protein